LEQEEKAIRKNITIVDDSNVQDFLKNLKRPERNTKKYTRVVEPKDLDDDALFEWRKEQIRRCKVGYDGLCGKMYFFFNFCKIKGRKPPVFRVAHSKWFEFVEERRKVHRGGVCVKARQKGWSTIEQADANHDLLFWEGSVTGIDSKDEHSAKKFFREMKLMYSSLPSWMRQWNNVSDKENELVLGDERPDANKNKEREEYSRVYCVAPTDSAHEGESLTKWISDEAGKKRNLEQIFEFTIEGLYQGEKQLQGIPLLFGTSGDITSFGAGLRYYWNNADKHELDTYFVPAWTGFEVDEYGNDSIDEAVIHYLKRRKGLKGKKLINEIQKNPLTIDEAFWANSEDVEWDTVKVNQQLIDLSANPPKVRQGWFRLEGGNPVFYDDPHGEVYIYELVQMGRKYLAGGDPADHDDPIRAKEVSDLAMLIAKKLVGTDGNNIVCRMSFRPNDLNIFFEQSYYALLYYNKAKVMVESNRFRMINWYQENGFTQFLKEEPINITKIVRSKSNRYGYYKSSSLTMKNKLTQNVVDYIDGYCHTIPDERLLLQLLTPKGDLVDALKSLCLYMEEEYVVRGKEEEKKKFQGTKYIRKNGRIIKVS